MIDRTFLISELSFYAQHKIVPCLLVVDFLLYLYMHFT